MKCRAIIWVLGYLLVVNTNVVAAPGYQELDSIVAVVEDDVVLASEMIDRLQRIRNQFEANNAQLPPNDILVSQLMERLIIERLQLQEADRRGLSISDERLTEAVGAYADQANMTLEEFSEALVADGISYLEFRQQIRQEMLISGLQRNVVNRRITITDQDISDLLNSPYYQQLLSDEFKVGHILLAIDSAATDGAIAEAEAAAIDIVETLRGGEDFSQIAIAKSAGARALEGGDLGWRRAGELPSLFTETVLQMRLGDVADPIRSSSGIHIIKLLDQRGAGMQKEIQTSLRHILVQPSEIRTEDETKSLIEKIYRELIEGADFSEQARVHSEDPGTALNGGDLGWTAGGEFVPAFREAMEDTQTKELSLPFRSQFGWHIIEVLARWEADLSEETRRNMALRIVHQRRFEEKLQEWLKELRDEAFVEVRL